MGLCGWKILTLLWKGQRLSILSFVASQSVACLLVISLSVVLPVRRTWAQEVLCSALLQQLIAICSNCLFVCFSHSIVEMSGMVSYPLHRHIKELNKYFSDWKNETSFGKKRLCLIAMIMPSAALWNESKASSTDSFCTCSGVAPNIKALSLYLLTSCEHQKRRTEIKTIWRTERWIWERKPMIILEVYICIF